MSEKSPEQMRLENFGSQSSDWRRGFVEGQKDAWKSIHKERENIFAITNRMAEQSARRAKWFAWLAVGFVALLVFHVSHYIYYHT